MPELPEVETTRLGITPHVESQTITKVTIRNYSLRWPIQSDIEDCLVGQHINHISRRAKYLLLHCTDGTLIIHLGMSGKLRVLDSADNVAKHDHADIQFGNGITLRYNDPRRFGAILWTQDDIQHHKLLEHLGPEPLSSEFNADYLSQKAQNRKVCIKTFIMDGKVVVGAGNIYANEALFLAKIHPKTITSQLSHSQFEQLVTTIKQVLEKAISAGGTTLKDFRKTDGQPGYFAQQLNVYGRDKQACYHCDNKIQTYKEAQRATYFCPLCQPLLN